MNRIKAVIGTKRKDNGKERNDNLLSGHNVTITRDGIPPTLAPSLLLSSPLETGKSFDTMDRFKIRGQVSSGAHGVIYKAVRKGQVNYPSTEVAPDQFLAIKRIFVRGNNLPLQVLREIKSLQLLSGHANVSDT